MAEPICPLCHSRYTEPSEEPKRGSHLCNLCDEWFTPEFMTTHTTGNVQANDADPVNRPAHYTSHPSGVECIDIAEHYGFRLGNAIKYIWRAGLKGDGTEDLEKARWYLDREIAKRKEQTP